MLHGRFIGLVFLFAAGSAFAVTDAEFEEMIRSAGPITQQQRDFFQSVRESLPEDGAKELLAIITKSGARTPQQLSEPDHGAVPDGAGNLPPAEEPIKPEREARREPDSAVRAGKPEFADPSTGLELPPAEGVADDPGIPPEQVFSGTRPGGETPTAPRTPASLTVPQPRSNPVGQSGPFSAPQTVYSQGAAPAGAPPQSPWQKQFDQIIRSARNRAATRAKTRGAVSTALGKVEIKGRGLDHKVPSAAAPETILPNSRAAAPADPARAPTAVNASQSTPPAQSSQPAAAQPNAKKETTTAKSDTAKPGQAASSSTTTQPPQISQQTLVALSGNQTFIVLPPKNAGAETPSFNLAEPSTEGEQLAPEKTDTSLPSSATINAISETEQTGEAMNEGSEQTNDLAVPINNKALWLLAIVAALGLAASAPSSKAKDEAAVSATEERPAGKDFFDEWPEAPKQRWGLRPVNFWFQDPPPNQTAFHLVLSLAWTATIGFVVYLFSLLRGEKPKN